MSITNFYEFQNLLVEELSSLFPSDLIFTGENVDELTNEIFIERDLESEKIGVIISPMGFTLSDQIGRKTTPLQKYTLFYEIGVVCPKELYAVVGGETFVNLLSLLSGKKLSKDYREIVFTIGNMGQFNQPKFSIDIAYLPINIKTEVVL
jgi:hypothetical protein